MELVFLWDWIDDPNMPAMNRFAGAGAPNDLGRAMREYWVRFARTGVPTAADEPQWTAYDTTDRPTLILDAERRIEMDFDEDVRRLWFS